MKRKLLQINSVVNSGSTGRIAEEIGQTAIENGWDSCIAYGRNDRESSSYKIKIGNDWDIKWHGIQTRLFDKHGFASKEATKKLIKQIHQIKPDIIHLHNIHGYYINIQLLFNYLSSITTPIVWTVHDCWPFTGHCSHFTFVGCKKWETQCFKCPQKTSYPASYLMDRSRENFNQKKDLFTSLSNLTLIPVSIWLSNILKDSFFNCYPQKIIHNGINIDIFKPLNNSSIKGKYNLKQFVVLGVASVWDERKGLQDFINLSPLLPENMSLVIVGLKDKQRKELPNKIIGINRTDNIQELAELYSLADVFVNPTWEDNFPTTNLEALACGTPVITYNTGGSIEAVTNETGFIVQQGNIEDILNCITKIKENDKMMYSKECRKHAVQNFNKKDCFMEYIQLYDNLLNSHSLKT